MAEQTESTGPRRAWAIVRIDTDCVPILQMEGSKRDLAIKVTKACLDATCAEIEQEVERLNRLKSAGRDFYMFTPVNVVPRGAGPVVKPGDPDYPV